MRGYCQEISNRVISVSKLGSNLIAAQFFIPRNLFGS